MPTTTTKDFFVSYPRWATSAVEEDPVLLLMLHLKNGWSLMGELDYRNITFTTRWYDMGIQMPQVCVRPVSGTYAITETGYNPTMLHVDRISVGVWVRPKQDSNTSIGWAKNVSYFCRREIERLISGSALEGSTASPAPVAVMGGGWRNLDDTSVRPPVFRDDYSLSVSYYRKRS